MTRNAPRWYGKIATLIAVFATLSFAAHAAPASVVEPTADLGAVLAELRKGGLVIYFRHGLTNRSGPKDEAADFAKCETQRELSAEGRALQGQVGKALRDLKVPIGAVFASPFCRCKETATLVSGRYEVDRDLLSSTGADEIESARLTGSLRRMLMTPPAAGTNTVIVSHSANLRDATGFWVKEGAAFVFRLGAGGNPEAIAQIAPQEWAEIARREASKKSR